MEAAQRRQNNLNSNNTKVVEALNLAVSDQ